MDDKTKKNKVRKSFDTISKEMARLIVIYFYIKKNLI